MTAKKLTFELLESGEYRKTNGFVYPKTWGGLKKKGFITKSDDGEWLYAKEAIEFLKTAQSKNKDTGEYDGALVWNIEVIGDHTATAKKVVDYSKMSKKELIAELEGNKS